MFLDVSYVGVNDGVWLNFDNLCSVCVGMNKM